MQKKSTVELRAKEALAFAEKLRATGLNWVQAHNALFGPCGKCTELFPTAQERAAFIKTQQHRRIQELIGKLPRPIVSDGKSIDEVSGRILVRVPRSVHASLLTEAEREGVSLNQLCLAKLSAPLQAAPALVKRGA
ncbi:MAG: toxin-antitoxin system HicB family antitoxin [Planctomycetia bacterium]|nr:toxin-antitoxin system HicB family antitoxin [Planctomycetia bacterium]